MADDEKTPETPAADEAASTSTPTGDANRARPNAETTPPPARPQGETVPAGETFTKAEIERIVQARLQADRDDAAKKAEKAKKDAVAAALKEQGDFAKLADAREAEVQEANRKIAELEPALTERDRYKAVLETHLEAQRKGLPRHILSLLDRLDVADQLEYLATNAEAVKAPAPEPKPNGSTPSRRSGTTAIGETTPQLPRPREPLARV